jgi:hypothetical protein
MNRTSTPKLHAHVTALVALALGGFSTAAPAQSPTVSDLGLSTSQIEAISARLDAQASAPGIAFGSPVAFGAGWGQIFAAIGGHTLPATANQSVDGSFQFGFGLGNPHSAFGLEVAATAISLRDNFGDDGNVSLKMHHTLPSRAAIAIGVDNLGRWGDARREGRSTYAVATKVFDLFPEATSPVPVSVNLGAGDNRFTAPGDNGVSVFGSIAIIPFSRVSLIGDWTGRDANAAVSLVPFHRVPLVVTLGAINLGERYGNEVEFSGGIGYLLRF